eukprot:CAMPEP_0195040438 /NCGR_PEP_ID=MMETSP0326_2-20130528/80332_1 /TAXON_ID=2866 ORGANISM="Crypthecodinium cohnii, Strain Seligo" /NCGR_SAMPLE_ID=MMETSP0326_2 /ASSEMBLY_ACC=CAM_ASM_000348 /LENGTH=216 /DNA_ID=CAMNT_0040067353 /DNA_START=243 /DNA_END=891 /DNA_ORIENTATION=-
MSTQRKTITIVIICCEPSPSPIPPFRDSTFMQHAGANYTSQQNKDFSLHGPSSMLKLQLHDLVAVPTDHDAASLLEVHPHSWPLSPSCCQDLPDDSCPGPGLPLLLLPSFLPRELFAFAAALAEALGLGPDGGSAAAAVVAWVGVGSDVASVASLAAGAAASVAASSGEAPSTAAAAGGGGEGPGPAHDNKGEVSGAAASSCAFSSLSPSVCVMSS